MACKPTTGPALYSAYLSHGRLRVDWALHAPGTRYLSHSAHRPPHPIGTYGPLGRFGFWYNGTPTATGKPKFALVLPIWSLVIPLAFLPTRHILHRRRRRHLQRRGLCLTCGYDLRASPQHCPECGADVPKWHNPPRYL